MHDIFVSCAFHVWCHFYSCLQSFLWKWYRRHLEPDEARCQDAEIELYIPTPFLYAFKVSECWKQHLIESRICWSGIRSVASGETYHRRLPCLAQASAIKMIFHPSKPVLGPCWQLTATSFFPLRIMNGICNKGRIQEAYPSLVDLNAQPTSTVTSLLLSCQGTKVSNYELTWLPFFHSNHLYPPIFLVTM